jgi:hypothetical protein
MRVARVGMVGGGEPREGDADQTDQDTATRRSQWWKSGWSEGLSWDKSERRENSMIGAWAKTRE